MRDLATTDLLDRFAAGFGELADIGRGADGWTRLAWTEEDAAARRWFIDHATELGLPVEQDRNGNLWAWWGEGRTDVVVTGSHLDTVPGGGAYDGALGVVAGLLAVEELQGQGHTTRRPVAVVAFADEEGGRFTTPTFGSRLMTGRLDPAAVRERRDATGVSLADAARAHGVDPERFGPDDRVERFYAFVELHVEQGRGLVDIGEPLALCEGIWPHGRWRATVEGEANHAGTTGLEDRSDPVVVLADAITAARTSGAQQAGVATVGRIEVVPNASNGVARRVDLWLDARAADDAALDRLVDGWQQAIRAAADAHGCTVAVAEESRTGGVGFDAELNERLRERLQRDGWTVPTLPTAAGHDAGILAPHVASAMLFVRNPTGISHSPEESASNADCVQGVLALAAVLEELACR